MYLLAVARLIPGKDASLFQAFSYPWTPSSTFYKLLEIERGMFGLLIVARPIAHNGRDNHSAGKNTSKMFILCVAEGGCLSLQARLHTPVVVSASLEALPPSKGACGGKWAMSRCPV